tara:strand:- start:77 stop:706 length:630 start_codon:yes stop_codon:yes gene_type:complete
MKYTQLNQKLNTKSLKEAIEFLSKKDSDLNQIIKKKNKQITLFDRPSGFTGLINLIVEQQLSVASAKAIFKRLKGSIVPFSAKQFLKTENKVFKAAGLSSQKIGYCLGIAEACLAGDINFNAFEKMSNESVVVQLVKFKGIGEWTAQCYLLGCMSRLDAWPASDLGLQVAIQRIKGLEKRPKRLTTEKIAEPWKPFRSVAALILWSSYD